MGVPVLVCVLGDKIEMVHETHEAGLWDVIVQEDTVD